MADEQPIVVQGTYTVRYQSTSKKAPPKRRDDMTRFWRGLAKIIGIVALFLSPWPIFNGGGTPFYIWGPMLFGGLYALYKTIADYYDADPFKAKRLGIKIVASIAVAWLVHHFWPSNRH